MFLSSISRKTPLLLFSGIRNLSQVTAAAPKPLPSVFQTHNHGFLKVSFALIFSVYFGSALAKLGAASLEENEIFVHYDDDDDE